MAKKKKDRKIFLCDSCGYESVNWLGKCPVCSEYNTFVEYKVQKDKDRLSLDDRKDKRPVKINDIEISKDVRIPTNLQELDKVLSGGIVKGQIILLGGPPGIGKSTLLLQTANELSKQNYNILYVSGEESSSQIKLRADRLNIDNKKISIFHETSLQQIIETVKKTRPDYLIIDSIQTVESEDLDSIAGSISQIKESTNYLVNYSKNNNLPLIIVCHITKQGDFAGPKLLEHMVDTVMYFDEDKKSFFRYIRTVKNRFGTIDERGIFKMTATGLISYDINNDYNQKDSNNNIGTVICPTIEGTNVILREFQALVTRSYFGIPRRLSVGFDNNRLNLIIAIIEKYCKIKLYEYDVYLNVTGDNIKLFEPSADLSAATAIVSSVMNKPVPDNTVFLGELSLTGDINSVSYLDKRIKIARTYGYKHFYIPNQNIKKDNKINIIDNIIQIKNIF